MKTLTQLERARLRWRARRGLLENDLIITKFLDQYEAELTDVDVAALDHLFLMSDHEFLDVLLGRSEPQGEYDSPDIHRLVAMMRSL